MNAIVLKNSNLPVLCPSCHEKLMVKGLKCGVCQTEINGSYNLPVFMQLSTDEQQFILQFVKNSGSLKEMAGYMKLSYPTVRNLLDEIIKKLNEYES